MTQTLNWKRIDYMGQTKVVMMKITFTTAETTIIFNTGLRRIFSYYVSPYVLTTKLNLQATVSGGTVTQTVTAPGADSYLYLTAFGI